MFVFGLVAIFGVFSVSLQPSEQAKSERSQHNIANLDKGSYLFVKFNRDSPWNDKVLIIKDWNGEIYVHLLPTENGAVALPYRFWGWAIATCIKFGPETEQNGKLVKSGIIKCHDKHEPKWWSFSEWEWSYSGKTLVQWKPDLFSPEFEIKDGTLYINK